MTLSAFTVKIYDMYDFRFFINAVLLGAALAIDAFSVSVVNGIYEPNIRKRKAFLIAGTFGCFQFLMPIVGWVFVSTLVSAFSVLERFIPYAALAILAVLGVRSIVTGVKGDETEKPAVTFGALLLQGLATSLDALSVGLTIAENDLLAAAVTSAIIGAITFIICVGGVFLGGKIGKAVSKRAFVIGGVVLIAIGIEIFIRGII